MHLAGVTVIAQQPLLQVLQPLGVHAQGAALRGDGEEVHVTHALLILVLLCCGGGEGSGSGGEWGKGEVRGDERGQTSGVVCAPACMAAVGAPTDARTALLMIINNTAIERGGRGKRV